MTNHDDAAACGVCKPGAVCGCCCTECGAPVYIRQDSRTGALPPAYRLGAGDVRLCKACYLGALGALGWPVKFGVSCACKDCQPPGFHGGQ